MGAGGYPTAMSQDTPETESDQQGEEAPPDYAVDDNEGGQVRKDVKQSPGTPQEEGEDDPGTTTGNPANAG